ncbi:hypothetical protein LXA43DRAFT_593685 [Ganoderma leucocontextum]|nr:hypothetical protein LXA43DRAFT_593685 [Ganoderma leucocontextum]
MANSATVQLHHDEFYRAFLSPPHINFRAKRVTLGPFARLHCANGLPENDISQHFITAVRTHHLIPGSTLTTVPFDALSMGYETKNTMHAAVYRSMDVPKRGHAHWADQKVPVQFSRYVAGADPFEETRLDEDYTEIRRERKRLREHIAAAAELLFATQQRVFLFMILIIGKRLRLLRWDRAGVIVTPSVDYVEQSVLLCDSLRRLSLLDDISLGFDPTATRLRTRDPDFMRMDAAAVDDPSDVHHTERRIQEGEIGDAFKFVFRYVRSLFRDTISGDWPRYRLRVEDRDDARDYLVGKPLHLPSGVVGRGTRGYVALDCETQRFVWLKDAWRACDLVTEREGDVLGKLNLAGVTNVPTLVCHGDVPNQATVTSEWWEITHGARPGSSSGQAMYPDGRKRKRDETTGGEDSSPDATGQLPPATARQPCPLRRHIHYRITFEEVAMPLTEFRCGKQLASVALDCLRAHHQAATNRKTRLLHRDISGGNMLIYPNVRLEDDGKGESMVWTGILTDWELAKPIDVPEETPRSLQANRVVRGIQDPFFRSPFTSLRIIAVQGTHQFMSVNLLGDPFQPVRIPDELESFFHVLVYYSVRYLRSNCASPNCWLNSYFLSCGLPKMYTGGMKTVAIQQDGRLTTVVPQGPLLFNSPMDKLLGELIESFTAHYKVTAHEFRQAFSPFSSSSGSGASSPGTDKTDPQAAVTTRARPLVIVPRLADDPELVEAMEEWEAHKPPDRTPTPEDRELARRVTDHTFALDLISGLLHHDAWFDNDRIPARARAAPVPDSEPALANGDEDGAPAQKRRPKAAPKEKTIAAELLKPTRRPATVRRTRSQTRAAPGKARLTRKS